MALADPQSLKVGGTATNHPRISSEGGKSVYKTPDAASTFTVAQQSAKRKRTQIRLDNTKIATDPITALNLQVGASVYLMVDRPIVGFSSVELKAIVDSLCEWATASSGANLVKVLGGES